MYNLLIIDDEPLILESLYQMILKNKFELFDHLLMYKSNLYNHMYQSLKNLMFSLQNNFLLIY